MEQSLLAAIRATPLDDLPRLVYADWLEENRREEQAEYIRHSIRCRGDISIKLHPYHRKLVSKLSSIFDRSVPNRKQMPTQLIEWGIDRGFLSHLYMHLPYVRRYYRVWKISAISSVVLHGSALGNIVMEGGRAYLVCPEYPHSVSDVRRWIYEEAKKEAVISSELRVNLLNIVPGDVRIDTIHSDQEKNHRILIQLRDTKALILLNQECGKIHESRRVRNG